MARKAEFRVDQGLKTGAGYDMNVWEPQSGPQNET